MYIRKMKHLRASKFWAFLCLICLYGGLQAQEQLRPLEGNYVLKQLDTPRPFYRARVIALPFFDDFYPEDVYPDSDLWEDDLVFINATYPVGPPTIGVATFDGLNANGDPYSTLSEASGIADLLTSVPIDLDGLNASDNVYLSFYFQPAGLGEAPTYDSSDVDNQDVLIVEFLDTMGNWDTLWIQAGDTLSPFEQVFVKVEDEKHFFDAFQFRFKSVGRLTGAFDHWHVDYVRMDKNRDPVIEENIPEMAYQYWPTPLISPYYVMPYNQFDSTYIADTHSVFIRNNFVQATTDIIDFYTAKELSGGTVLNTYAGPSRDIGPLVSLQEDYESFDVPEDIDEDTVTIRASYRFLVSAEDTTNAVSNRNNRVVKDQVFSNYYSYDDGSAERAYLLDVHSGDALFGRVAVKYEAQVADTLRAIKIHLVNLNQELDLVNFSLYIWSSLETDSTESEVLYREFFINAGDLLTGDSLGMINDFLYIPINPDHILSEEEHLILEGDFYIGYQVAVNVKLPIGFDLNTDGSNFHYINFGQFWSPTQFAGSIMINPVMGSPLPDRYIVGLRDDVVSFGLELFPNPVSHVLKVRSELIAGRIEVLDILGRPVMERNTSFENYIDVSGLQPGIYILQMTDLHSGSSAARQFVKQ